MTNFEYFATNIERMAKYLSELPECRPDRSGDICKRYDNCYKCWLGWLKKTRWENESNA